MGSEYCLGGARRVGDGDGGQQKPMREEVRVKEAGHEMEEGKL